MEYLAEYGLFLAEAVTVVVAVLVIGGGLLALGSRQRHEEEGHIEVRPLNERYRNFHETLQQAVLTEEDFKRERKARKKRDKQSQKSTAKGGESDTQDRLRLYVIDFDGDIKASATQDLREEISAVLGYCPQRR